jgi:TetR/AcrR family transcriptional regulator, transcriptional repressor for nem operon
LRPSHLETPAHGCAFASLTPEIAGHSDPTRAALTDKYGEYINLIMTHLPGSADPLARRRRALAIFTMMMGTIQLARAVSDKALFHEILESGTAAVLDSARMPDPSPPNARATERTRLRAGRKEA